MYLLTDLEDGRRPGWRYVPSGAEAGGNEALAAEAPEDGEVWDAATGALREETMHLLAAHVSAICLALSIPIGSKLGQVVQVGERALQKKAEVEAANTPELLEKVRWDG